MAALLLFRWIQNIWVGWWPANITLKDFLLYMKSKALKERLALRKLYKLGIEVRKSIGYPISMEWMQHLYYNVRFPSSVCSDWSTKSCNSYSLENQSEYSNMSLLLNVFVYSSNFNIQGFHFIHHHSTPCHVFPLYKSKWW